MLAAAEGAREEAVAPEGGRGWPRVGGLLKKQGTKDVVKDATGTESSPAGDAKARRGFNPSLVASAAAKRATAAAAASHAAVRSGQTALGKRGSKRPSF